MLAVDEHTRGHEDSFMHGVAQGVIAFDQVTRDYGVTRRRLEVPKVAVPSTGRAFTISVIVMGASRFSPRLVAA